jgi:hypothetical protein
MPVLTAPPVSRLTAVAVDLDDTPPALPGVPRAEQDRVAARLRAHLERDPQARVAFLRDPEAVLRAAVPDAAPALLSAVAAARRSAPPLPAGLSLDRVPIRVGRPRPIRPVPRPAAAPPAHPLGGFDACLAVGGDQLGGILADLLGPFLSGALAELLPTNGAFSLGLIDVVVAPTAAIDAVQGRVRLTVTAGVVLTVLGSDTPLPGLTAEIALDVAFGTTGTGSDREMVIDRAGVEVTLLGLALPPLLLDPVLELIAGAVGGIFPRPFPVDLPGGTPATCDIGLRDLAVAVLPGQGSTTQGCLAVLTSLLADAEGDVAALRSPLPVDRTAGLFLDNVFLLRSIACEVQHSPQLAGLPAPTHQAQRTDPVPFVEWTGLSLEQEADGRTIEIRALKVAIDGADPRHKSFVVTADLRVVHPLFKADVALRVPLTLRAQDGALHVDVGEVTHVAHVRLRLLGIVIEVALAIVVGVLAAILSSVIGVLGGAAITVGVFGALVAALVIAVHRRIGAAITAATTAPIAPIEPEQVIPKPLLELFGALAVDAVVLDDLEVYGTLVAAPRRVRLVHQVLDRSSEQAGTTPAGEVFHLSTTVRFRAVPTRLEAPVAYEWRVGRRRFGRPDVPVPGIAETTVAGSTCIVRSVSGADVDIRVTVTATDRLGSTHTASAPLRLEGKLIVPSDELPDDKPDPTMPIQP